MKKIMFIFGTRPEAIKLAPLIKEFLNHQDEFQTTVCVTGQHREMLDQVLILFNIVPDYNLDIMERGQDLYDITVKVLLKLRDVLREVKPDAVFVHGDTTTAMSAALAAFYQQIDVVHVEAGLRTNNIYSPWPEELNRQIIGRIAKYHMAPTLLNRENLLREGVHDSSIFVTGNTGIDALFMVINQIKSNISLKLKIKSNLIMSGIPEKRTNLFFINNECVSRKFVLITGHRRENFGEGFINICKAIKMLAEKYPYVDFVYPVHFNPNVRKPIQDIFGEDLIPPDYSKKNLKDSNIFFIEPLDYLSFVFLMEKSYLILTDSGGIQEEAPSLGKPVLVMRNTTERPEAIRLGTVKLVGSDIKTIIFEVSRLFEDNAYYLKLSRAINPYGDGRASERILKLWINLTK